jgi:hypothetical protein
VLLNRVLRRWLLIGLAFCPAGMAWAQQAFGPERLDQLTAQIALYPDALLSQVLMASTYPDEVAAAAKWAREHPDAKGDEAVQQVEGFDWDPSVASLVAYPQVIVTMGEKPDWVRELGDAFLEQPDDVMDSVQRLRAQAQKAGNLQSTEQMKVSVEPAPPAPQTTVVQQAAPQQIIVIEPAQPQVVYVPSYNPVTVYGPWMYPAYPPIYVPPPPGYWWSVTIGSAIAWGIGNAIGNSLWGGYDWRRRDININVNRYNVVNYNRRLDAKTAKTRWSHDTKHRGNVPYRGGEATRQQLDRKAQSVKRDNYRGRAEATMRDKGIAVDRTASRDRPQLAAKDMTRDRPQPATRDAARDRPQPGKAQAANDRAALAQATKQRDQSLKRDRDAARAELNRAGRDNAFKGADSPKARPQIDRGIKSQQTMQQRPMARPQTRPQTGPQTQPKPKPMARPQARPMPKPMARPQARPQSKPMARPQGRPQARAAR